MGLLRLRLRMLVALLLPVEECGGAGGEACGSDGCADGVRVVSWMCTASRSMKSGSKDWSHRCVAMVRGVELVVRRRRFSTNAYNSKQHRNRFV